MKSVLSMTHDIFTQPTAPYREQWVLTQIESELKRLKCPFTHDRWGNIIAGVKSLRELKKSQRMALVAHTDHPGFHLKKKIKDGLWQAQWFGGCPPKIYKAYVAIHHPQFPQFKVRGVIKSRKLSVQKKKTVEPTGQLFEIQVPKLATHLDSTCFGAFDFPGFKLKGDRITTRAADDLAGVVIILSTLERLNLKQRKNFIGIFTRAEETGFRGALGLLADNILGTNNTAISLEASRQLPGARLGLGPVIRLGDKKSLFDSGVISLLDESSTNLQKKSKSFKTQRRIMNGGTCEATPFNLSNIRTGGMAVPLGNYHNQKANGTPGPEFINARDVERGVALCVETYKNIASGSAPMKTLKSILAREFKKDAFRLKEKIKFAARSK